MRVSFLQDALLTEHFFKTRMGTCVVLSLASLSCHLHPSWCLGRNFVLPGCLSSGLVTSKSIGYISLSFLQIEIL